jgi:hypothetical protein
MMLALFDPATDKSLETFSVTIGGLLAAVYYTKEIFWRKDNKQLDVNIVETLATKSELQKLEDEDKILHGRITDQGMAFQRSLNDLPGQIVALLRNTGAIK